MILSSFMIDGAGPGDGAGSVACPGPQDGAPPWALSRARRPHSALGACSSGSGEKGRAVVNKAVTLTERQSGVSRLQDLTRYCCGLLRMSCSEVISLFLTHVHDVNSVFFLLWWPSQQNSVIAVQTTYMRSALMS